MQFTVEGNYLIKCSWRWESKKRDASRFLKMFPDRRQNFNGLKHLSQKVRNCSEQNFLLVYSARQDFKFCQKKRPWATIFLR